MESTCTCGSRNDLRDTSDLAGNRHHPPGIGAPGHAQSTQTVGPPVAAASRLRCCTRKHEAQVRQRRPARPIPNLMASREPGRPANANPMAASAACRPRVPLGQPRYLLDERARAAVDVVAEEPAHRQPHQHRPPCDGCAAITTGSDTVDVVDHHRRQMRKQNPATALTSHNPRAPRQAGRHHAKCARTTYRDQRHSGCTP